MQIATIEISTFICTKRAMAQIPRISANRLISGVGKAPSCSRRVQARARKVHQARRNWRRTASGRNETFGGERPPQVTQDRKLMREPLPELKCGANAIALERRCCGLRVTREGGAIPDDMTESAVALQELNQTISSSRATPKGLLRINSTRAWIVDRSFLSGGSKMSA
jgi:hypothetical protein